MPFSEEDLMLFKGTAGGSKVLKKYDDEHALVLLNERYSDDHRQIQKYPRERQWFMNIANFSGYQYVVWDETFRNLREPRAPNWRIRSVTNLIHPKAMRAMSTLVAAPIPWKNSVMPNSTDIEDEMSARVGEKYLQHAIDDDLAEELRTEAAYWKINTGQVFWKSFFDPDDGEPQRIYIDPNSKEPIPEFLVTDEVRRILDEKGSYVEYRPGKIKLELVNPFRIFVDPMAANHRDLRWMMQVTLKDKGELKRKYGKDIKFDSTKSQTQSQYYENRLLHLTGAFGFTTYSSVYGKNDLCEEKELFMAPYYDEVEDRTYEHGRHIVSIGSHVVINTDNAYHRIGFRDHGFPYDIDYYTRIPGSYWGQSFTEHQISPQRYYNFINNRVLENFKLMNASKWIIPKEAEVGRRSITTKSGEIIFYAAKKTGGAKPEQVSPAPLNPQYMDQRNKIEQDMNTIASQPEVSRGMAPGSVKSGIGIKALQDEALRPMSPTLNAQELLFSEIGTKRLILANKFETEDKLLKVFGRDGNYEVAKFKGADLRGNTTVRIRRGSMSPKWASGEIDVALALVNSGGLNPRENEEDRTLFLKAVGYGEIEGVFKHKDASCRRARIENDMMANPLRPLVPQVKKWDNHQIHMAEHNYLRNSDTYERLPKVVRDAIDAHCSEHEKIIDAQMKQQMQVAMAMKGTPGQKGEPGRPAVKVGG